MFPSFSFVLLLFSAQVLYVFSHPYQASSFIPPTKRHLPIVLSLFSQRDTIKNPNAVNPTIFPTDFGADPTGKTDSTTAFENAMSVLLSRHVNNSLANGIKDLGGAVLDLEGGDYTISKPLVIPQNYGNLRIVRGTLRASRYFPSYSYLIEVGSTACSNDQGSCNENIGFSELMLDCKNLCAGGLQITAIMGANVGPQMFFLGFQVAGISIIGGHEVMVHETWLGQYLYSDPKSTEPAFVTATGIQVFGNDHYVVDTIVFSSRIGVELRGAANLLSGVHTWNLSTSKGGTGILVNAPGYTQNRLLGCYLDYNSIVAIDPEHLTIANGFFLCGGNIVLKASKRYHSINGLNIIGNQYDNCQNESVVLDQSEAQFTGVYDTVIENNMMTSGIKIKSTRAKASYHQTNAKRWEFNFSNRLLFPTIETVQYSIQLDDGFVRHAARPVSGNVVVVETDLPVSGTVTVWVDQSKESQPCGALCK